MRKGHPWPVNRPVYCSLSKAPHLSSPSLPPVEILTHWMGAIQEGGLYSSDRKEYAPSVGQGREKEVVRLTARAGFPPASLALILEVAGCLANALLSLLPSPDLASQLSGKHCRRYRIVQICSAMLELQRERLDDFFERLRFHLASQPRAALE